MKIDVAEDRGQPPPTCRRAPGTARAADGGNKMTHKLWLSASAVALIWTGAAHAQAQSANAQASGKVSADATVAELVVTAERRTENLQTTAIAATVISGDDLINKGVLTVDSLQFALPGVTVNNFGQGND